jgi:hypothetical protein
VIFIESNFFAHTDSSDQRLQILARPYVVKRHHAKTNHSNCRAADEEFTTILRQLESSPGINRQIFGQTENVENHSAKNYVWKKSGHRQD